MGKALWALSLCACRPISIWARSALLIATIMENAESWQLANASTYPSLSGEEASSLPPELWLVIVEYLTLRLHSGCQQKGERNVLEHNVEGGCQEQCTSDTKNIVLSHSGFLGDPGTALHSPVLDLKELRMDCYEHIQSVLTSPILTSLEILEVRRVELFPLFQYLNQFPSLVSLTIEDRSQSEVDSQGAFPLLLDRLAGNPPNLSSLEYNCTPSSIEDLCRSTCWSRSSTYSHAHGLEVPMDYQNSPLEDLIIIMNKPLKLGEFQEIFHQNLSLTWATPSLKELRFIDVELTHVSTQDAVDMIVREMAFPLRTENSFPAIELLSMHFLLFDHWVDYCYPLVASE
ncbi:hypothetical protein FB446DRAFT_833234 [Lentinula raphanica]|nr:hypothetical protein FB446DRAFT_833234 [Lentinula raphanica]